MKQSILFLCCVFCCLSSFGQSDESNALFKKGIELYHQQKYKEAISEFKRCQELDDLELDSLDFRKEYAKGWIAHCYYKLSDYVNAKALGVKDYDIIPIDRTLIAESDSIISLAQLIASNGNLPYAITKLKEGLNIEIQKLGDDNYAVANTHAMLATMYASIDKMDFAETELQKAKQIYKNHNLSESYAYGTLLLRDAFFNQKNQNPTRCIRLAEEALSLFKKWDNANYSELIDVYYLLALGHNTPVPNENGEKYILYLFEQLKHVNESEVYGYAQQITSCCQGLLYFQHTLEALDLLNFSLNYVKGHSLLIGNDNFYISLLSTRANILQNLNRFDDALVDVKSVITVCENTMFFDKNMLDEIYVLLANIYYYKREPQLQLEAAREAYNRASSRKDDRSLVKANAKSHMAGAHNALDNKKEALADLQETLSLYEQLGLGNSINYASSLSLKAEIEALNDPLQAIEDYKRSANIYLNQKPIFYDGLANAKLSLFHLLKKQLYDEEADALLDEIVALSNDSNIPISSRDKIKISLYGTKGNLVSMEDPSKAISFYKQAIEIAQKYDGFDTSSFDVNLALSYTRNYELKTATIIIDSLLLQLEGNPSRSLQYANALRCAAVINGTKGDVSQTRYYQAKSLKLFEKIYGKKSLSYASALNVFSYQLLQLGLPLDAYPLCKEAEKIALTYFPPDDPEMSAYYTSTQLAELAIGNVDNAIEYGEKAKTISEKYAPPFARSEILCNLSLCYSQKFQFNEALSLLEEAMAISEKVKGRINMQCASIYVKLAGVYQAMGNTSDARVNRSCYYEIVKRLADPKQPQYGMALMFDADQKLQENNIEEAKSIATEALSVFENSLGDKNPITLQVKATIASLNIQEGKLSEAIHDLELIYKEQIKNKYPDMETMNLLATTYGMNNNFKEQKSLAEKMMDLSQKKYGKESQQVGNAYLLLANAYFGLGNTRKSADYSSKAFDICRKTILNNFLFMTKNERADLWNSVSNFFLVMLPTSCASVDNHVDYSQVTYNAALLSKGLLLQAETNISDMIYNSGNDRLKSEYNHFLNTKNMYNNATASYSTDVDLKEMFRTKSIIDSLENEIIDQEHSLMKHISAELGNYTSNLSTTWIDVREALSESDMAVEFLNATWNYDSTKYFALVLTRDSKYPIYIDLLNSKEIEEYRNFKSLSEKELRYFSECLWEPILSRFPHVKNIYFSPCGELYNLPIESLPSYYGNSYLSNDYRFYRLSSTRELSASYNKWQHNAVSLYGDIKYDASASDLLENYKKYNKERSLNYNFTELITDDSNRGKISLSPLPGTAEEVSSIASLVKSSSTFTLSGSPCVGIEASEASVKAMSGKGDRVLHIATHGFYYPKENIASSKYLQSVFAIENKGGVVTYESPEDAALLRCGLFMAGAKTRLSGTKIPGADDGILTAREISMINLNGLDLAILSACETGIGDISGDGVFGLQRGFKKAGTHSILMSLWKVDDDATSFLMKEFYNSWLSGKSKQESLEYAKKQVRERPEWNLPKYWSAFVLLDAIDNK